VKKQPSKTSSKDSAKEEGSLFKDLTFNVHLNDNDMEAKKNLILPYEIIGSEMNFFLFIALRPFLYFKIFD